MISTRTRKFSSRLMCANDDTEFPEETDSEKLK
jgi:hypothetical protein